MLFRLRMAGTLSVKRSAARSPAWSRLIGWRRPALVLAAVLVAILVAVIAAERSPAAPRARGEPSPLEALR